MYKFYISVLAPFILIVFNVQAQSKFDGFSTQVGLGYETATAKVNNEFFKADGNGYMAQGTWGVNANVNKPSGLDFPVSIQYALSIGPKYSLSFGAEYINNKRNFSDSSTAPNAQNGGGDFIFPVSTSSVKNRYNLFIAPGYDLDTESQIYGKLGFSSAKFVNNDGSGDQAKLRGLILGLGYKTFLTSHIYLFAEGDYVTMKTNPITGSDPIFTSANYSYDVSGSTVNAIVGLGYKF